MWFFENLQTFRRNISQSLSMPKRKQEASIMGKYAVVGSMRAVESIVGFGEWMGMNPDL
jgi:hypothetical protein